MAVLAYALPVLPGHSEEAASFGAELDAAGLRDRYEELNRRAGVQSHTEWLQRGPAGDILVVAFESDAPERLFRPFTEGDAYDDWWRARVQRVFGFDPADVTEGPQTAFSWSADR